jgi:PBP1b-binding outer membrane lipoprotein LpoB
MKTNILVLCAVTAMWIVGCNVTQTAPAEQREQERQFRAQQASVDQLAKATDARFNNMPVTELLAALEQAAIKRAGAF